ncbi:uncharacterized protein LOC9631997 [Selaginella moellendorffii]|uniref:uncharacterized protein LOC9631997 n=1 Tax=Selaginella moellendorffii TaxID=88036 RepID=UPI000D1C52A5|nr:uncharacterized protein LOC9631997 [Selaginella moellendorffii]|eukprot:XP_024531061.1 uncharacterized protein LOC9631997 [Selaginella moellendorffii]
MFPGGSVEELELTTGFLSRVWYYEKRRLSSTRTIKHVFLVVAEDDIKAIAKAASNLVYSCDVQCVSMISPRDKREVWRWQRTHLPDLTSFESLLLGESTTGKLQCQDLLLIINKLLQNNVYLERPPRRP